MYDELRELNDLINRKQERIDEIKTALTSMSAPIGLRVQSSAEDRMSNLMCKLIIAQNELDTLIDEYTDMKATIEGEIFSVPREEWQDILYMHYIEFKPIYEIADLKGATVAAIKMKNQRALRALKKVKL